MKFKAGDKVKITKAMLEQDKKYEGKVVTIKYKCPNDSDSYMVEENCRPWKYCELELVEEKGEIILKAIKNEQGVYEIRMPKEIEIYCYGRNGDYEYIKCIKKEEILDDVEKEYLRAVIRPFRNRVKYIRKNFAANDREYIDININGERVSFPCFKKGTMYKGMEINKKYSFEELGL